MSSQQPGALRRELGTFDAVMIGLGSMIGAGIFAALAPAARSAGSALLIGLCVAAVIAYCNATSSARLAAVYPASGGTYVYGRERLGDFWGYLALGIRGGQDRVMRGDGVDDRLLRMARTCACRRGGIGGGADGD